jgi:signal peptidase I
MNDATHGQLGRRNTFARAGLTALNLFVPGLGLARLGLWRIAVPFLVAPFVLMGLFTLGMGHFPINGYGMALFALSILIVLGAALFLVPAVLTWRGSRVRLPAHGWSRWYALAVIAVIVVLATNVAVPLLHGFYKPFYAPSESMEPTIEQGDRFVGDMRWRGPFRRGDLIIFNGPDDRRISRIIGVAGDRIAMRGGVPVVNGFAAVQSAAGRTAYRTSEGLQPATIFTERLPGERSTHRVLDSGESAEDEMGEVTVPAKSLFVLGDNRDESADSRVPREFGGVAMVPTSAVIGRPTFIDWSVDHSRIGTRLDK